MSSTFDKVPWNAARTGFDLGQSYYEERKKKEEYRASAAELERRADATIKIAAARAHSRLELGAAEVEILRMNTDIAVGELAREYEDTLSLLAPQNTHSAQSALGQILEGMDRNLFLAQAEGDYNKRSAEWQAKSEADAIAHEGKVRAYDFRHEAKMLRKRAEGSSIWAGIGGAVVGGWLGSIFS